MRRVLSPIAVLILVAAAPARAPGEDKAAIIDRITANYRRFRAIPSFSVDYVLIHEYYRIKQRMFAFDRCEVRFFREGDKLRLSFLGYRERDGHMRQIADRRASWDGEIGMKKPDNNPDIYIWHKPGDHLYWYNFYVDYLGYPEARGSVQRALGEPAKISRDYWVPATLDHNRDRYLLRGATDRVDGIECHVLDWPRHDTLWVRASDAAVLRRDYYHPGTDVLKERTLYTDHRDVAGLSLPHTIVREEYALLDDDPSIYNRLCSKKVLSVAAMSTADIDDRLFRLEVENGVQVTDMIRNITYIKTDSDEDPLDASVKLAEELSRTGPMNAWRWATLCVVAFAAAIFWASARLIRRPHKP